MNTRGVKLVLRIGIAFALFENLATISQILNEMLLAGDPLPLQKFLNNFSSLWTATDAIWNLLLTSSIATIIFKSYAFGGFTFVAFLWVLIKYIDKNAVISELTPVETKGRRLAGVYALLFLLTIIYGLNRTKWVPYVQDPNWQINLVHKQQLSAGTFFIIFFLIWASGSLPKLPTYQHTLNLYKMPQYMTYIASIFMFENFGSFDWFFTGYGYEDIFLNGETLFTFDKAFHFSMSSAFALLLLFYSAKPMKAVGTVISLTIFWELFKISLNPLESSDSLLDLMCSKVELLIPILCCIPILSHLLPFYTVIYIQ